MGNVITMTALSRQIDGVEGVSWCHGAGNVITMTAWSRQIDVVEGVSWCGARSVLVTKWHSMFAVAE